MIFPEKFYVPATKGIDTYQICPYTRKWTQKDRAVASLLAQESLQCLSTWEAFSGSPSLLRFYPFPNPDLAIPLSFSPSLFSSFPPSVPSFLQDLIISGWPWICYGIKNGLELLTSCFQLTNAGITDCCCQACLMQLEGKTQSSVCARQTLCQLGYGALGMHFLMVTWSWRWDIGGERREWWEKLVIVEHPQSDGWYMTGVLWRLFCRKYILALCPGFTTMDVGC